MSLDVPGQGSVRVIWRPADLSGPDSDGERGRRGQRIWGIVHHRIVGTLRTTIDSTFEPSNDPLLTPGERRVASHFGIGYYDGRLTIAQFVALEDTAYTQGQSERDRAACRWQPWVDAGRPLVNNLCVSIEHEDGAKANRYVVEEPIIAASIALDRLLLAGDAAAIRAAGIRTTDEAARQLQRLQIDADTLIDHNVVAPVSKPYCWRAIGGDRGFPQERYIRELRLPEGETEMPIQFKPITSTTPVLVDIPPGRRYFEGDGETVYSTEPTGRTRVISREGVMIGDREFRWVLNPTGTRPVLVLPNNVRPFEEITPEDITRARAAVLEQARNEATTAVGEAIDRVAQGG